MFCFIIWLIKTTDKGLSGMCTSCCTCQSISDVCWLITHVLVLSYLFICMYKLFTSSCLFCFFDTFSWDHYSSYYYDCSILVPSNLILCIMGPNLPDSSPTYGSLISKDLIWEYPSFKLISQGIQSINTLLHGNKLNIQYRCL